MKELLQKLLMFFVGKKAGYSLYESRKIDLAEGSATYVLIPGAGHGGHVIKKDRLFSQNGHSKQYLFERCRQACTIVISAKRNRRGVAVGDSAGDASSPVDGSLASSPCKTDWSPPPQPGALSERNAPEGCIIAPSHP